MSGAFCDKHRRELRAAVSAAMKRRAKATTCPKCGRGNALIKRTSSDGAVAVSRCRWCDYSREYDRSGP